MKKIFHQFGFTKLRFALLVCMMAVGMTSWGQANQTVKAVVPTAKVKSTTSQTTFGRKSQANATAIPSLTSSRAPLRAGATLYKVVCEGTQTSQYIPFYGFYYDYRYQINQMIYPQTYLENLVGKTITSLRFYANSNIGFNSGAFKLSLGTTFQTTFGTTITRLSTTTVATKNMTSCVTGSELLITFDTPFTYTGGNLVVDIETTTRGNEARTYFYGITSTNSSFYSTSTTANSSTLGSTSSQSFLPKVEFGYESTAPIITASPDVVNFDIQPGESDSKTVTIGGFNLTDDITATLNDPNGVYSLNTTSLSSNGGDLVITYSPSAQGTHAATITLTSTGADPVTVTINGTCHIKTDATICDGTTPNEYLPVYGYYYDEDQINQMLYPVSKLQGTGMNGKKITKITFYPTTGTSGSTTYNGINFYKNNNNATVTVKLANMPSGTAGYSAAPYHKDAYFKVVKTITMPTNPQTSLTEWVFDNLDEEFIYNGGDLLIEVTTEKGGYQHTFFAGETYAGGGYHSYSTTAAVDNFLPKVRFDWEDAVPVTSGTVQPQALTYTDVEAGTTSTQTVTVTNTGNQPFTPEIDTNGLPAEFTVTGAAQVQPGQSITLTVTYAPTAVGTSNGSFTVTIADQTYPVTVTGNAIVVNRTLCSNEQIVHVYKSDVRFIGHNSYDESYVIGDRDRLLDRNTGVNDLDVHAKANFTDVNMPISSYELMRKNASTWETASTTAHDGSADEWKNIVDNAGNEDAYYIPVTHATSIGGYASTYGAAPRQVQNYTLSAQVAYAEMSAKSKGATYWTDDDNNIYTHYQVLLDIDQLVLPFGMEDNDEYDLYMVRVWRQADIDLLNEQTFPTDGANAGKNRAERIDDDFLFEEVVYPDYSKTSVFNADNRYNLGSSENLTYLYPTWTKNGTNEVRATFGAIKLREGDETGDNVADKIDLNFVVRAYYTHVDNLEETSSTAGNRSLAPKRADGDGKYYIMDYNLPYTLELSSIVTGVKSVMTERQVVGVTYYNMMGMESSKPFEGVNIVVTRYSDGTYSTIKVLK